MPVYEYHCDAHGPFDALRPLAAYAEPCPCPACAQPARRILLTAPRLASSDRSRIAAHAVNERSAHEPRRSKAHGAGCGCCSGGGARRAGAPPAAKGFPSKRPWMISH